MNDSSGYALYNGYTGNTAFLHARHEDSQSPLVEAETFLQPFTRKDIQLALGISDDEVSRMLNWLLKSDFIQEKRG